VLVTVIAGRIIPAFTGNALRRAGSETVPATHRWLEVVAIGSVVAIAVCDLIKPDSVFAATLAAIAAVAHALRLAGWKSFRVGGEPILWVLHVAYAWVPLALALKACWLFGGFDFAAKWQHALTSGAFATMILAVMTRVSLGSHRPCADGGACHYRGLPVAHRRRLAASVRRRIVSGAVPVDIDVFRPRLDRSLPVLRMGVRALTDIPAGRWPARLRG
jgi:uncharacterized protein involved in response to NO